MADGKFSIGTSQTANSFVMDTTGNVGIGTTTPDQKLSIKGRVSSDLGDSYYGAWFEGNSATNGYSFFSVGPWYNSAGYFQRKEGAAYSHIYEYAANHHIVIQAGYGVNGETAGGGNVGIGTTSPLTKAQIHTAGATISNGNAIRASTMKGLTISNSSNDETSVGLWFGTNTAHWSGISGQRNDDGTWDTDLRFYTHEAATIDLTYSRERMRIDGDGNVGIGTPSPKDVLHIQTGGGDGQAFGGKTLSLTTSFQTGAQLAITLGDHQGCYVKVFITGDWSGHSAMAFLGEYFVQNGATGYAEPGVIIREVDNTSSVDSLSSQIVDSTDDTFQIQFKLNQTHSAETAYGRMEYQIMGQFDTIA